MTRQEAIRTGVNKYDSDKAYPRGHVEKRYVRSGSCVTCHKGHYSKKYWDTHDRKAYQRGYYERRMTNHPEEIFHQVAKARAKKLGLPFTITPDDVKSAWPEDGNCPALGIPLSRNVGKGPSPNSPSLDRLIPELGYVPGNIAIISMRANLIKQRETTPVALRKLATWIEENICVKG